MRLFTSKLSPIVVMLLAFAIAACTRLPDKSGWELHSPWGAPIVLKKGENFATRMSEINAYAHLVRTGLKTDVDEIKSFLIAACPYVSEAQAALPSVQSTAVTLLGATAGQKQVSNAVSALNVASEACAVGTNSQLDWKTLFQATVEAINFVKGMQAKQAAAK